MPKSRPLELSPAFQELARIARRHPVVAAALRSVCDETELEDRARARPVPPRRTTRTHPKPAERRPVGRRYG
jgi:hypothetical protein